jgi:pyruvyl transferase EpsO
LGDLSRPESPQSKIVWLRRTDVESLGYACSDAHLDVYQTDWRSDPRSWGFRANSFLTRHSRNETPILRRFASSLSCAYDALARRRLLRGCGILSRGQVVVTDRLHGHILSLLMGIPQVLLDNSYGKVKSFYDTWTKSCGLATWAESIEEALDKARLLAQRANHPADHAVA